jgi:hypothetical protein
MTKASVTQMLLTGRTAVSQVLGGKALKLTSTDPGSVGEILLSQNAAIEHLSEVSW